MIFYLAFRTKKRKRKPSGKGYVYFIQDEDTRHVKIGVSQNPEKRLKQLNTGDVGSNLRIIKLIYVKQPFKLEKKLHYKFRRHRISPKGEWFHRRIWWRIWFL